MPPTTKGEVRRSQLITTYGVGAILAVEDESFMVAGIDRWEPGQPDLHEPRLERRLGVDGFRVPPASDGGDIPVVRFPQWAHCPSCKRLNSHRNMTGIFNNTCNDCGEHLIPSRFVMCCPRGHIDDFPYFNWVHAGSKPTGSQHRMTIDTSGDTAALSDIVISCTCGKQATMDGAFHKTALRGVSECKGRRPWLSRDDAECQESPRVLQRGASNVWFSITHSAISIPPWSEGAFLVLNKHWEVLRHINDETALRNVIVGMRLDQKSIYSIDDLLEAIAQRRADETADRHDRPSRSLKHDEWLALLRGRPEQSKNQEFVCVPVNRITSRTRAVFDRIMLVKKLREVRVLESFSRIVPPSPIRQVDDPPLAQEHLGWLPAVEVNGEGVFMTLDRSSLLEWERNEAVHARIQQIDANYRRRFESVGGSADRVIGPRLVLVHTLAHALIDQWSLDSGYPSSSLRERLYIEEDSAGLLLYTASADSAGSLGGVVAQAQPDRLEAAINELAQRMAWCSSDPLCIESGPSGVDGLNLAACHSCCLLPEVSCEEMNLLLDRALLVGLPSTPEMGYLRMLD